MKTDQLKKEEIKRQRHNLDAKDQILGRLATQIAGLLVGKGKSEYAFHLDVGDFVKVVNVEKVTVTGKKEVQKLYRRHSGYPGGFKVVNLAMMRQKHPERILKFAVAGMLPDNRLKKARLARLELVIGEGKEKENGQKD